MKTIEQECSSKSVLFNVFPTIAVDGHADV